MNKKFFLFCMALGAGFLFFACKKSNGPSTQQVSAGTGTYTLNNVTYSTNDTLAPDPFSGQKDLSMYPTNGTKAWLFIYNMPTASSGTTQFTDGTNDTTVFVLGFFPGPNGNVNYSSNGVTGSLTKTGATSFTFSATVYDDSNPNTTYSVQGSGTY